MKLSMHSMFFRAWNTPLRHHWYFFFILLKESSSVKRITSVAHLLYVAECCSLSPKQPLHSSFLLIETVFKQMVIRNPYSYGREDSCPGPLLYLGDNHISILGIPFPLAKLDSEVDMWQFWQVKQNKSASFAPYPK